MKKYKNKATGNVIESTDAEMIANYTVNWPSAWEVEASISYKSLAKRGVTAIDKLTGVWSITAVNASKGGPNGFNPILALEQNDIKKRCYVHPSELPNTKEDGQEFTWSPPSLTSSSSVVIKDGNVVFNW
jgi:hypothetical protein